MVFVQCMHKKYLDLLESPVTLLLKRREPLVADCPRKGKPPYPWRQDKLAHYLSSSVKKTMTKNGSLGGDEEAMIL
jgi:hypothetical protein